MNFTKLCIYCIYFLLIPSLAFFISPFLPPSLYLSPSLCVSPSLCLFLSLSVYLSLFLSFYLNPSLNICIYIIKVIRAK